LQFYDIAFGVGEIDESYLSGARNLYRNDIPKLSPTGGEDGIIGDKVCVDILRHPSEPRSDLYRCAFSGIDVISEET